MESFYSCLKWRILRCWERAPENILLCARPNTQASALTCHRSLWQGSKNSAIHINVRQKDGHITDIVGDFPRKQIIEEIAKIERTWKLV